MNMEKVIQELQDTATVMAGIQAKQARMMEDHAEWLVAHDKAIAEQRERGREIDERIEKLVIAIGKLIQGGNNG